MMTNIYDFIYSNSSSFDQLEFDGKKNMFIDYLCPLKEEKARVWTHKNCLMYVMGGVKGYDTNSNYHESRENQLLFMRKGGFILHQYFREPYRALIFMFDDIVIKKILLEYPVLLASNHARDMDFHQHPSITELSCNPFVKNIFISSLNYLKDPTQESAISLEIKFKELFVNILRDKRSTMFTAYLSWLSNASDAAFIKLMRENCHYNFTTKELARIACMSESTFKRMFFRIFNMAPGKWLRDQRTSRAVNLLCSTHKTVAEIAFDLGYSDAASFSKAFKGTTGINPSAYRKNLHELN